MGAKSTTASSEDDNMSGAISRDVDDTNDEQKHAHDQHDAEDATASSSALFDTRLQAVSKALEDVEPPGDFFVSGTRSLYPLPGIVLDGLGHVPLPLVESIAHALIQKCHLAPYGLGEQTLLDTRVRNTWELGSHQFRLENPAWNDYVQHEILPAIRVPLGIHASVQVEAKLYKILLYEVGGKFERHQDSEKQDGMFGTLVVVLPGRFEGGELLVHDPLAAQRLSPQRLSTLKTHVWNPGAMDAFTVKYAAFYGDCPHQVKPVTKGYRLCLTYNLIAVETNASEPRFGSNHPLYATLKDTLCTFFCKEQTNEQKRQRVNEAGAKKSTGFDITSPETHRAIQLVYVLSHKYTKAGLSFQYLKNKDALVAASLHGFCEESKGAFEVFLGKCRFIYSDLYNEEIPKDPPQQLSSDAHLFLYRPWVDASGAATVGDPQMNDVDNSRYDTTPWLADLLTEVAPAGLFDRKDLAFDDKTELVATGNDGAMIEKWYSSAVLVLVPVQIRAARQFGDDPLTVLESWPRLVESSPSHAKAVALGIALSAREWSITSPLGINVLDGVGKCGSLDVLRGVLASCLEIDFQPRLRQVASVFGADDVAAMLQSLDQTWQSCEYQHAAGKGLCRVPLERNRVNVVTSLLDGVHDAATIGTILDAIPLAPFAFETQTTTLETSSHETTPTEFARAIALAATVSADRATRLLETHSLRTLVLVVAPATLLVAESTPQANVPAVVAYVVDQLVHKIPTIRNLTYASTPWFWSYVDSPECRVAHESFRRFLENTDQLCTVVDKAAFDTQLLPQIRDGYLMDKLSVEPDATDANAVVVTKTVRNELLCKAEDDLRALQNILLTRL